MKSTISEIEVRILEVSCTREAASAELGIRIPGLTYQGGNAEQDLVKANKFLDACEKEFASKIRSRMLKVFPHGRISISFGHVRAGSFDFNALIEALSPLKIEQLEKLGEAVLLAYDYIGKYPKFKEGLEEVAKDLKKNSLWFAGKATKMLVAIYDGGNTESTETLQRKEKVSQAAETERDKSLRDEEGRKAQHAANIARLDKMIGPRKKRGSS